MTLSKLNLQTRYLSPEELAKCSDISREQVKLAVDFLLSSKEVVKAVSELIPTDWVNDFIENSSTLDDVTVFLYDLFHIFEEYAVPSVWTE